MYKTIMVDETGKILGVGSGNNGIQYQLPITDEFYASIKAAGVSALQSGFRVVLPAELSATDLPARPLLPILHDKASIQADGVDSVTFSNIPIGTTVSYGITSPIPISDATLVVTHNVVESITFTFHNWPYQDLSVTINAA